MRSLSLFAFFLASVPTLPSQAQEPAGQAGAHFRITQSYETKSADSDGGSRSSSSGHTTYLERIISVGPDGDVREFDLPPNTEGNVQKIEWQFPVRVLTSADGTRTLLNLKEMEDRRDIWLKQAGLTIDHCGKWYFTWNAFQVQCDPQAILALVDDLEIQPVRLEAGATLSHPAASSPGTLREITRSGSKREYRTEMPVDPEFFFRQAANGAVVTAEIMGEPVSFDEAYADAADEKISGTVAIVLEADMHGQVFRRTDIVSTDRVDDEGAIVRSESIYTTERVLESKP